MSRYAKDDNGNWHIIAGTGHEADNVVYDNTSSGLTANDVQEAIDEINAEKQSTYSSDSTQWDTTPTASSTKPVTSGGIKTELDKKLPTYANDSSSWDTTPTNGSTKPVTSGGVYSAIPALSYVGMVIHSTTLNTEAKVKAYYGGTKWIQHSGYVLRGATSGVTSNSATKTGGSDNAIVPYHTHTVNGGSHRHNIIVFLGGSGSMTPKLGSTFDISSGVGYQWSEYDGGHTHDCSYAGTNGNTTNANIPNYKSVYIWERTQ